MSSIDVIRAPRIAWRNDQQVGIEIGFQICDEVTRRVRLEWEVTSTSGDHERGDTGPLPIDANSCVMATAALPPQDLTAVFTLWDADRETAALWRGTSYLTVAGFEPQLVPSPGEPLPG